jgi:hypothetical protein
MKQYILCIKFSCPSPGTEDLPTTCIACSRISSFAPLHIFFDMHFLQYALILAIAYVGLPSLLVHHPSSAPLSVLLRFLSQGRVLTEPLNAGEDMCTPNFSLPVHPECISSHYCLPRIGACVPCIVLLLSRARLCQYIWLCPWCL